MNDQDSMLPEDVFFRGQPATGASFHAKLETEHAGHTNVFEASGFRRAFQSWARKPIVLESAIYGASPVAEITVGSRSSQVNVHSRVTSSCKMLHITVSLTNEPLDAPRDHCDPSHYIWKQGYADYQKKKLVTRDSLAYIDNKPLTQHQAWPRLVIS